MKERYNLSWSEDGEVLTWREHEYFIFDEAASAESDTDRQITSIYMPFAALRATLAGARATQMVSFIFIHILSLVHYSFHLFFFLFFRGIVIYDNL